MGFLVNADDDHLVALSNKGILKRAYKDLESADISAEYSDEAAVVSVSGETCTITADLGESKCTCPSRSVCRHIVTAILWLRDNSPDAQHDDAPEKKTESRFSDQLYSALSGMTLPELQKLMKKTYYTLFVMKAKNGKLPEAEELAADENSVVMVSLPDDNIKVRLMMPLENSVCTCHSKSLCRHKAAAILAWQIKKGLLDLSQLSQFKESFSEIDEEQVCDTAYEAKAFLSKLLSEGLVRAAEDIPETAEMFAVMCHNARMADSERQLREISGRLSGYISHSPSFKAEHLFSRIMEAMILFDKIISSSDEHELRRYIGEFKSTYVAENDLEILPIASREFSSPSGYEGKIFYFVNKTSPERYRFLTYSDVRPVFYQTTGKRNVRTYAPWNLSFGINELLKYELRLYSPKLSGNKLSSSNDTKADIISAAKLDCPCVRELVYTDFQRMAIEVFSDASVSDNDESERLVLLSPRRCISSRSDEITQSHTIEIEDKNGKVIHIKAYYKPENAAFFRSFSNVGDIMMKSPEKRFTVFGSLYIEESGRFCVYPIAVFDSIAVNGADEKEEPIKTRDYSMFYEHFTDVNKALCDIIQCGINSYDLYERIKDHSAESGKMGLLILSEKLDLLYRKLLERNHALSFDNSGITALLTELYTYISAGLEHIRLSKAISLLTADKE